MALRRGHIIAGCAGFFIGAVALLPWALYPRARYQIVSPRPGLVYRIDTRTGQTWHTITGGWTPITEGPGPIKPFPGD